MYEPYNKVYNKVQEKEKDIIEKFETSESLDCDIYMKHILECRRCKDMVTRQFNIDADRINNEEILEVISYLIFGLFILLLINSIKGN